MNIEEARDYCLSKPFATEDMPFGEDCVVFRVAEKIFADLSLSQGNVIQMKCNPTDFDEILAQYPHISQAYHWHKRHWIQLNLDDNPPREVLTRLIDRAYEVVVNKLPRKKREELFHFASK